MVLPLLGGAPTVWSVAFVFFQVTLLGGYAYAHLLVRYIPLGIGALLHFGTLAAAAAMLPIGVASGFGLPPMDNIAFWLIGLLAVSIGLPFAALSTTAPLLQRWFSASGAQSLRSLCRLQSRLVRHPLRLSHADRAVPAAAHAGADVVARLRRLYSSVGRRRIGRHALDKPPDNRGDGRIRRVIRRQTALAGAGRRSGRPGHRRNLLCLD
jgi:hypothetical protein